MNIVEVFGHVCDYVVEVEHNFTSHKNEITVEKWMFSCSWLCKCFSIEKLHKILEQIKATDMWEQFENYQKYLSTVWELLEILWISLRIIRNTERTVWELLEILENSLRIIRNTCLEYMNSWSIMQL